MISIMTPVWNHYEVTRRHIEQLRSTIKEGEVELIICDDGSTDQTNELSTCDTIRYIRSEVNQGFGASNNLMAQHARGDILVLMNNDVIVHGEVARCLADNVKNNPLDMFGADLVNYDGGWNSFGEIIVPYIPAWCLALSRDLWDRLGGFDVETFEKNDCEDMDLCWRAAQLGSKLHRVAVPIVHLGAVTAPHSPERYAVTLAHKTAFAKKHKLGEHRNGSEAQNSS